MVISMDFRGCYLEHKEFFDLMAIAMQSKGHKVGIIAGIREKEYDMRNVLHDYKKEITDTLGFKPDFMHLWGESETISNGSKWKISKMVQEEVNIHFDSDATEIKKYTTGSIIKTMDSGQKGKF